MPPLALLLLAEVPSDAQVRSAHVEATVTVVRAVNSRALATPDTVVARPESPGPVVVTVKYENTPKDGAALHVYVCLVRRVVAAAVPVLDLPPAARGHPLAAHRPLTGP